MIIIIRPVGPSDMIFVLPLCGHGIMFPGSGYVTPASLLIPVVKKKPLCYFNFAMPERRRYRRFIVDDLAIQCNIKFIADVKLLNIGLGGASIRTAQRLDIGSEYTMRIECPDGDMDIKGMVLWERVSGCIKKEDGEVVPVYDVGIKFRNVLTTEGHYLIHFIDSNFTDPDDKVRLTGARVEMAEPEKTSILDVKSKYLVLKMSQGGVMIETEKQFEVDSDFWMDMVLPEVDSPVRFRGRIASCIEVPDSSPRRYHVGIEFVEMEDEGRPIVEEFISFLQSL